MFDCCLSPPAHHDVATLVLARKHTRRGRPPFNLKTSRDARPSHRCGSLNGGLIEMVMNACLASPCRDMKRFNEEANS